MSKRRDFKRFSKDSTGAITIEFVVTLPLFLAALAFAFEFGQIFLAHQSTVNNVRSAARYLARTSLTADDFDRANSIIRTGQVAGGSAPDYLAGECATSFSCATFDSDTNQLRVQVRVNYPLALFGFISDDTRPCVDDNGRPCIPFVVEEHVGWVGM
jgi:Flp pilus assembly protein TadG